MEKKRTASVAKHARSIFRRGKLGSKGNPSIYNSTSTNSHSLLTGYPERGTRRLRKPGESLRETQWDVQGSFCCRCTREVQRRIEDLADVMHATRESIHRFRLRRGRYYQHKVDAMNQSTIRSSKICSPRIILPLARISTKERYFYVR